jgi:peptide/nickel transport system ATP-binding protein
MIATAAATTEKPVLSIRDLHTSFYTDLGAVRAVRGVDLDVPPGKTLCLVGESGSGKSITAYSALRLIDPPGRIDRGTILYHDGSDELNLTELDESSAAMRSMRGNRIAMISQEPMSALSPVHTVGSQIIEVILLHQNTSKQAAKQQAIETMRLTGIPKPEQRFSQYPHEMSGGLRQRVVIAMALVCRPHLLIADEPTTALDVTIQAQILSLMHKLQDEIGMAILFITHDLGVVAQIADEVAVMYLGRIVERATADEIFENPQHPYTRGLLRSIPGSPGTENGELQTIRGSVPHGTVVPPGCAFFERCDDAVAGRCNASGYNPRLTPVSPTHQAACWKATEEGAS